MSQVIKRQEEDPESPVDYEANGDCRSQYHDFRDAPSRIDRIFSFDLGINGLRIFPNVTKKDVTPWILRLAIVAMSINGNPIVRMSMLIRAIAIAHMVAMVHMLVEGLRDSQGHRFHDAEQPIQDP